MTLSVGDEITISVEAADALKVDPAGPYWVKEIFWGPLDRTRRAVDIGFGRQFSVYENHCFSKKKTLAEKERDTWGAEQRHRDANLRAVFGGSSRASVETAPAIVQSRRKIASVYKTSPNTCDVVIESVVTHHAISAEEAAVHLSSKGYSVTVR